MNSSNLHIFFLPFPSPGHMIPIVDIAKLFAIRNVKVTIVTTKYNIPLIQRSISNHDIQLLTIEMSSSIQNTAQLPSPALTSDFIHAINSLQEPFQSLVTQHRPDFIISDAFYPWTSYLGIPRILFCVSSSFVWVVERAIYINKLHETVQGDEDPFVVTGLPHRFEMTRSMLFVSDSTDVTEPTDDNNELLGQMIKSYSACYGMVLNTVYRFEKEYHDMLEMKAWAVGPVFMCNDEKEKEVRGGGAESGFIVEWLDRKGAGSVLYVCFGSLGRFTYTQLREIGLGLVESGFPFVWAIKDGEDPEGWMPDGYDKEKGMVVTGWVPQMVILNHVSVGGFMTHCGWNSTIEGLSTGLPMVTWPLYSDQFCNERFLVDVMRVGVAVGSVVSSYNAERRTLVKSEEVRRAVVEVMGDGEEADERRKRAKEAAKVAEEAVKEGGSSFTAMDRLVKEMTEYKKSKDK